MSDIILTWSPNQLISIGIFCCFLVGFVSLLVALVGEVRDYFKSRNEK